MKVLLSWLQEFAPFPDDPSVIAQSFDDLGTPVEEFDVLGEGWDGVVVARVLKLRSHPNADKIQLVDVDLGPAADAPLQICCGAFNMTEGDLVPLATLGTTMPGGMVIERRKLRGEWSNGMLCSARELGLSDEHNGISILSPDLTVGAPLADALGIEPDVLFDLEVNPNRPDAMSVAGLARDLAAKLGIDFRLPEPSVAVSGAPASGSATVEVLAPDLCGRFAVWVLRGVRVCDSPDWMQRRLRSLGMRPINALVDISNYVMLELGQPNHPYDLALVGGGGFRVRRAQPDETVVTLDDVERELVTDDLLICDASDVAVGIAGVMGGAACEISESTTDVLLEMAWFDPASISRTSRRLGLRSEASARFDKGCDPEVIPLAAARFCQLAAEICGATSAPGFVDRAGELPSRVPVRLRTSRVNAMLGTDLSAADIRDLLEPIGFACTAADDDNEVAIPPWRYDSSVEIDLVEEVARHWGYGRIPMRELTAPRRGGLSAHQRHRRSVRGLLTGLGLAEAMPLPFLAPGDLERCGLDPQAIRLVNPMVADESVLRTALLPGLVKSVALNATRRSFGVAMFEVGHVFLPAREGQLLPDEREHLAVILAGREAPSAVEIWYLLADRLGVECPTVANLAVAGLHPTRSAHALVGGEQVGFVGEIDPSVLGDFGIAERVAYLEIDLNAMLATPKQAGEYRQISRFPSSDIDLAFEVPDPISAIDVEQTLRAASSLVWSVKLFDIYRGGQVAAGTRSLAFAVRFQASDRTLTDAEVASARAELVAAVEAAHGVVLRGPT